MPDKKDDAEELPKVEVIEVPPRGEPGNKEVPAEEQPDQEIGPVEVTEVPPRGEPGNEEGVLPVPGSKVRDKPETRGKPASTKAAEKKSTADEEEEEKQKELAKARALSGQSKGKYETR